MILSHRVIEFYCLLSFVQIINFQNNLRLQFPENLFFLMIFLILPFLSREETLMDQLLLAQAKIRKGNDTDLYQLVIVVLGFK